MRAWREFRPPFFVKNYPQKHKHQPFPISFAAASQCFAIDLLARSHYPNKAGIRYSNQVGWCSNYQSPVSTSTGPTHLQNMLKRASFALRCSCVHPCVSNGRLVREARTRLPGPRTLKTQKTNVRTRLSFSVDSLEPIFETS